MANLTSLSISIDRNPIGKTESTGLKVIANYSDSTTRDVTYDCTFNYNTDIAYIEPNNGLENEYLTFEAIESGTFKFSTSSLQYSLNNGSTWTTLAANTNSPTVAAGSKIMWKQTGLTASNQYGIGTFTATGNFKASGNVMSLYYGDNFANQKSFTSTSGYDFKYLFNGNTKLIDASNLILPVRTLTGGCYYGMFQQCSNLLYPPKILATKLAYQCCAHMFYYCTNLQEGPTLYAMDLDTTCVYAYQNMFYNCRYMKHMTCYSMPNFNDHYIIAYQYWLQNAGTYVNTSADPAHLDVLVNSTWMTTHDNYNNDYRGIYTLNFYALIMFIDDFPEDLIENEGASIVDDFIDDPLNMGSNIYIYLEKFTYDGNTYYIWEKLNTDVFDRNPEPDYDTEGVHYILTSMDIYTLQQFSLEKNKGNLTTFPDIIYLFDDLEFYNDNAHCENNIISIGMMELHNESWIGGNLHIYIDHDFDNGATAAGFGNVVNYVNACIQNPEYYTLDHYRLYGSYFYGNGFKYIWIYIGNDTDCIQFIITESSNYQTLYNQSLQYSTSNLNTHPIIGYLNDDYKPMYTSGNKSHCIVKVIRY